MNDFNDVLLVVFGWLLGTLSPSVGRAILREYRRRDILRGLSTECVELRFTIAAALFNSRSVLRELDQPTLQLVKPIFLSYHGDDDRELVESFRRLVSKGNDAVIKSMNERSPKSSDQWPMPYDLALLEAHLGELTQLPMKKQEQLVRIRAELRLFNEQVAYVRHLLDRTFELSGPNYDINSANLAISQRNLAVRSEALVRTLNRFLQESSVQAT